MIYFAQAGERGPIKIGFTAARPEKRLAELQVGCPFRLKLLGSREGDLTNEAMLHAWLSAFRTHGEWFRPCKEVMVTVSSVLAVDYEWPVAALDPATVEQALVANDGPGIEAELRGHLLVCGRFYADAAHKELSTIGREAAGDWRFFTRLAAHEVSFTLRKYDLVIAWFDANWPVGAPWPASVKRPSREVVRAAS